MSLSLSFKARCFVGTILYHLFAKHIPSNNAWCDYCWRINIPDERNAWIHHMKSHNYPQELIDRDIGKAKWD